MTTVAYLERRIKQLEEALQTSGKYLCPLCGGVMSASTKWNNFYCIQSFGYCGEWVLSKNSTGQKKPFTAYHRTTVKDGAVAPTSWNTNNDRHYFFIAGKEVSRVDYMRAAGLETETS